MEQTLGERIAANRKRLGLTQDQLAEKLGVTAQAVSKWENNQSCPDIGMLPRLAAIFGTSTDNLLGCQDAPVQEAEVVDASVRTHPHRDVRKYAAIGLAALVLAVGALYLCTQLLQWDVSIWDILWPTALLVFGITGMIAKFSFFSLGCSLLGGFFLIRNLFPLPFADNTGIIIAVVILLCGCSLLADALRKPKQTHHIYDRHATNNYEVDADTFQYSASFGENRQQVCLPELRYGQINTSFGEFTVDLNGITSVTKECRIEASCNFGELKLRVPRHFAVKPVSSTAFAAFTVKGQPSDTPSGQIVLDAKASFGEIQLIYTD